MLNRHRAIIFLFASGLTAKVNGGPAYETSVPLIPRAEGVEAVVRSTYTIDSLCCRTSTFSSIVKLYMPNAWVKIKNKQRIIVPMVDLYFERNSQVVDHCSLALAVVRVARSPNPKRVFPVRYTQALVFEVKRSIFLGASQVVGGAPGSGHCDSDEYGKGPESRINSVPVFQSGDLLRLQVDNAKTVAIATVP